MRLDLSLALRQMRGLSGRIPLLLLSVAVGVAARVSVGSFSGRIERALERESRQLLLADLEIRGRSEWTAKERELVFAGVPEGTRRQKIASFLTMAANPAAGRSKLVAVRAVEPGFPFYGELQVSGARLEALFADDPAVFVQEELCAQLGVEPGGRVRIGRKRFRVAGILEKDPGAAASAFSPGPRVLMAYAQVDPAGLSGLGAVMSRATLLRLPDGADVESAARALRAALSRLPAPGNRSVRTHRDAARQVERAFDRLGDFLRLASLLALVLGGVGVSAALRSFVREENESFAVLRALGASSALLVRVAIFQAALLGAAGGLLGAALGTAVQGILPFLLSPLLPVSLSAGLELSSVAWGLLLGLLVSVLSAVLPVVEISRISPMRLWREEDRPRIPAWAAAGVVAGSGAAVAAVAVFEARSVRTGLVFAGVLCGGALVLWLSSRLLLSRASALVPRGAAFAVRHGLSNLSRPAAGGAAAAVSLGLASLLLGVFSVVGHGLLSGLSAPGGRALPDFFLVDIPRDAVGQVRDLFAAQGASLVTLSPMVRARWTGMNGRALADEDGPTREAQSAGRLRSREQNLSFREELGADEEVVSGRWMARDPGQNEASLEEGWARRTGAGLGDTLTFDVQGVAVTARVTSLRRVRWRGVRPNFFILLSPAALDGAPQMWVGAVGGLPADRRAAAVGRLAALHPSVTVVDVREAAAKLSRILDQIAVALRFLAGFSVVTGVVVLLSIAAGSARQRLREAALLRTLGAARGVLAVSLLSEFAAWGLGSAALGLSLAVGAGGAFLRLVFDLPLAVPVRSLVLLAAGITVLCAATGLLSCRRIFSVKPLEVLREESG